jgi:oligopeptidase B
VWLERDRDKGRQQIRVRRWADEAEHAITFGEEPAKVELAVGLEQKTRTLRYTYQSMVQPLQVIDYDLDARTRTQRKVQEIPSGHDPSRYVTRRIEAPAPDGTRIPATVLYRKDTPLDGSAPVWLYAYGAYGDTEYPDFGTERLSLVDRGFINVIAHVRGGGEKGEPWHAAGRLGNKVTSFTDFIAVAEHLIREKWTSKDRLAIEGGSAGGLLIGAVVNLRPDVAGAAILRVPFVDVINTMLDESLPLTVGEFEEWGDPRVREQYEYMKSYSPYDNIAARAYPAMLVKTSFNDSQVMYWEPAKYVARLREMKTDSNPLVFKVNMAGGHGGSSGRYDKLSETAFDYAFLLTRLGVADAEVTAPK